MARELNNIIFLNSQNSREQDILTYLDNLNIKDSYICNKENGIYIVVYYKKELVIITFELLNFVHRNVKIEMFNNIEFKYNEDLENGWYENQLEFHFNNDFIKLYANENDKALELRKFLIR